MKHLGRPGGGDERQQQRRCNRLADGGTPVVDVCRQIGISEVTFYTWKKKYADLGVSELRKLKQLEDENARLRRIVADLTLDKQSPCRRSSKKKL